MCRYPLVILLVDAALAQYPSQLSQRAVGSPLAIPAAVVAPVAPLWLPSARESSVREPEYFRVQLRGCQQGAAHAFLRGSPGHVILSGLCLKPPVVAVATLFVPQIKIKRLFKHNVCVGVLECRKAECWTCRCLKNVATKEPAGVRLCCYKVKSSASRVL